MKTILFAVLFVMAAWCYPAASQPITPIAPLSVELLPVAEAEAGYPKVAKGTKCPYPDSCVLFTPTQYRETADYITNLEHLIVGQERELRLYHTLGAARDSLLAVRTAQYEITTAELTDQQAANARLRQQVAALNDDYEKHKRFSKWYMHWQTWASLVAVTGTSYLGGRVHQAIR